MSRREGEADPGAYGARVGWHRQRVGVAEAGRVDGDYAVTLGEARHHVPPGMDRLRPARQQDNGISLAGFGQADTDVVDGHEAALQRSLLRWTFGLTRC